MALGLESAFVIMSVEEERILETAGMLAEGQGLHLLGTVPKPLTIEKLEPLLARIRNIPGKNALGAPLAPESDLRAAFVGNELTLMYQPKVSLRSGEFAGAEALVRWKHPTLGLFQPAAFIPIIEESDDYSAMLTEFCLCEAIACAGRWTAAGQPLSIAINLSPHAFDRLDLPERVEALAKDANVSPDHITLEVTETQIERDAVRMIDVATRLRLKGFRLSIDDFGTGQSGLVKLQTLPFNELKIDRRFVDGCASSAAKRAVVQASLALSQSLRMVSVAEGVQQRPDWDLLTELGCDVMQGFFIARPMTEDGLAAWATQWAMRQR